MTDIPPFKGGQGRDADDVRAAGIAILLPLLVSILVWLLVLTIAYRCSNDS